MRGLPGLRGCLWGLALGDAMGKAGQMRPERTLALYGEVMSPVAPPADDPIHGGMGPLQVTDDTMAALAMMRAVIHDGRLTVEGAARELVEWIDAIDGMAQPFVGPSTKRAVTLLKQGVSPREAGRWGWTNGAAMRVAPLGFLRPGEIPATVDLAEAASMSTHGTCIAISGAAAVACAVSSCAAGAGSTDEVIAAAKEGARLGAQRGFDYLCPSITRRIDLALELVAAPTPATAKRRDLYDLIGTGLACYEVVPVALACFAWAGGDPMTAITHATNTGGDADTVGAIAGAIGGAFAGDGAFDRELIAELEAANRFSLDDICRDFWAAAGMGRP